jgi:hypothetical protein
VGRSGGSATFADARETNQHLQRPETGETGRAGPAQPDPDPHPYLVRAFLPFAQHGPVLEWVVLARRD